MLSPIARANLMLKAFGTVKIPLIGYVGPKVVRLDDEVAELRVRLSRRTKNHWGSMYFGALAIGADTAAGLHAMQLIDAEKRRSGKRIGFVFRDVEAEFLFRPDGHVTFRSDSGAAVNEAVERAASTGERVDLPVPVTCLVAGRDQPVARFTLTLSLKAR